MIAFLPEHNHGGSGCRYPVLLPLGVATPSSILLVTDPTRSKPPELIDETDSARSTEVQPEWLCNEVPVMRHSWDKSAYMRYGILSHANVYRRIFAGLSLSPCNGSNGSKCHQVTYIKYSEKPKCHTLPQSPIWCVYTNVVGGRERRGMYLKVLFILLFGHLDEVIQSQRLRHNVCTRCHCSISQVCHSKNPKACCADVPDKID